MLQPTQPVHSFDEECQRFVTKSQAHEVGLARHVESRSQFEPGEMIRGVAKVGEMKRGEARR